MPAVVKKPSEKIQDEALAAVEAVDLSDAPALKPYRTLRVRERGGIMALFDTLGDTENLSVAESVAVIANMDEALEGVAVSPEAYAAWAVGDDAEARIMALFTRYAEQVGESMRSAS